MKRGTTPCLVVAIKPIDFEAIDHVDFLFRQDNSETSCPKLEKQYPTDVTYDAEREAFLVPLTQEETRRFAPNRNVYMDTRIVLTDGHIPATPIVKLYMHPTLFEGGETYDRCNCSCR